MTADESIKPHEPEKVSSVSHVVLVGHCGFDQSTLGRAVSQALPGLAVESVYDQAGLDRFAGPDALLLINRVLDGRFGTSSGIDLITQLAGRPDPPRMMLISNYPEAQAQAVEAGALPGFGKNATRSPDTAAQIREAAGANTDT